MIRLVKTARKMRRIHEVHQMIDEHPSASRKEAKLSPNSVGACRVSLTS